MWITVFLGWLDTRFNGETTPGKSCKAVYPPLNQPPIIYAS